MCLNESHPVYLDCAASTPVVPDVLSVATHFMSDQYGNAASGAHGFGQRARAAVEKARHQVARVVAANRSEVIFTSGATESNNLAILGLVAHGIETSRRHIITTQIEHQSVLQPIENLRQAGFEITYLPVDSGGQVSSDDLASALRKDTILVSVMQINNETGVQQPLERIIEALNHHQAYLHVDAAQGFGKVMHPLQSKRIDLISVSGHKIYAPSGVGALIARRRNKIRPPLQPQMIGGGQEFGLRSGTLPVHLIAALGKASDLALIDYVKRGETCRAFKGRVLAALSPFDICLHGDQVHVVDHMVNLSINNIDAAVLIDALSEWVAISDGAACSTASQTCSHVLGAMALNEAQINGAVRLSWSHLTPEPKWRKIADIIKAL